MTVSSRSRCCGFVVGFGLLAAGTIVFAAGRPTALLPVQAKSSASGVAPAQASADQVASKGAEIVVHGGYPELRVGGEPFFIHSAAFFYYRIPRDLWDVSLERYRALGINTIDIYIPWNWHELSEGQFDFDGHTNPRRDLRALLKLIAGKNLKVIARPGPLILNEWRFGGYPGWLLERADFQAAMPAEYRMDNFDLLEGRYPPLVGLNARDAEAAAKAWLANPLHMDYSRKWLETVGRELAPYGGLLFVQVDDDVASGRANTAGAALWRYLEALRDSLLAGGVRVPFFIDPTDMRVPAAPSALTEPIGVMGQWYLRADHLGWSGNENEIHRRDAEGAEFKELKLTADDVSTIEFFTEELKTQPGFPPGLIEYQAGWYAPGDDDRPLESAAENTLDSSRLFLAHGLHGISYFPLQDSVTPAGWSVPWANQNYLWNAALDPNGHSRRRADAVERNGEIISRWGPQLAASHKRADFGLAYPVGAYEQSAITAADIRRVSLGVQKIERLAQLDHLSSELLDPEYQPVEQLLRDPMILLPVFDTAPDRAPGAGAASVEAGPVLLSEKSQRALVEYVRSGGTLVIFPRRPTGGPLAELWKDAPTASAEPSDVIAATWNFAAGRVIESSKDFFSWIDLRQSFIENRRQESAAWAMRALDQLLKPAGINPAVRIQGNTLEASSLVVTELISNEGTGNLGARTGENGWLSVTNLNGEDAIEASLSVLGPSASSVGETPLRLALDLIVPPRESLLLPLGVSLCLDEKTAANCTDAAMVSGAELVSAARENKTLELTFYSPARAEVRLRLEGQPSHVEVEDTTTESKWSPERHELVLSISRGASPGFRRRLKVQLPYVPYVPAVARGSDRGRGWSEMSVVNAVRLPLGLTTNLGTSPPLIVVDDPRAAHVTFEASNTDPEFKGDIDVNITGAYKGSASLRIFAGQVAVDTTKLKPSAGEDRAGNSGVPDENGLLHGNIDAREKHDHKRSAIYYVPLRPDATTAYRYDFDGDGALEWVLENASVRIIVSPASGGRALALVDKTTGFDLVSSVGALRDGFSFTPNPPRISPERARGRYGLFNRAYEAVWVAEAKNTVLSLRYHAAEIFPDGADVEKKVELNGNSASISYHVSLNAARAAEGETNGAAAEAQPQSFIATQSVPALDEPGRLTKFCWSAAFVEEKQTAAAKPEAHCENFAPGGAALEIPAEVNHLDVRTPGRPGLAIEWDSGRVTIAPKRYSALVELHSPVLKPGDETRATMRLRVLAPD